jgi:hypothetical protein
MTFSEALHIVACICLNSSGTEEKQLVLKMTKFLFLTGHTSTDQSTESVTALWPCTMNLILLIIQTGNVNCVCRLN